MTNVFNFRSTPSKDYIYGLCDPDGEGLCFYKTEAERNQAVQKIIESYEGDDEVTSVFAFIVTHKVIQTKDDFDEDCDYELKPI